MNKIWKVIKADKATTAINFISMLNSARHDLIIATLETIQEMIVLLHLKSGYQIDVDAFFAATKRMIEINTSKEGIETIRAASQSAMQDEVLSEGNPNFISKKGFN